jgi:hypothetical protein
MGLIDAYPDRYLPLDPISGNQRTIDPVHGVIHDGVHFTASHYVSVGAATAVTVLITPPGTATNQIIHFAAEFQAANSGIFTFSKDPVTTAGTTLVSHNNNQVSSITDPVALKHTVTVNVASIGTVLQTMIVQGASTNQVVTGGGGKHDNEWLLDPTKQYLVRFVADNAATRVVVNLSYYYRPGA